MYLTTPSLVSSVKGTLQGFLAKSVFGAMFAERMRMFSSGGVNPGWIYKYEFGNVVQHGYYSNIWVYRCIREIVDAMGIVPWYAYTVDEKRNQVRLKDTDALSELLAQPNPYQVWSEFIKDAMTFFMLSGELYIHMVRSGEDNDQGRVLELWVLPSHFVRPIVNKRNSAIVDRYGIVKDPNDPDSEIRRYLKPHEVLAMRTSDPLQRHRGVSSVWVARNTVATEAALNQWNRQIFENAAIAGGYFITEGSLTPEQREEMRDELQQFVTKRHRPMLLEGGVEYKQWSYTQKDMDFPKLKGANALEICAAFGVPPENVGAVPARYEDYGQRRLSFWEETLMAIIREVEQKLQRVVAPTFGKGIRITFDIVKIPAFRSAIAEQAKIAVDLQKVGYPLNDITSVLLLPFPFYPWGDEPFLHSGQTPLELLLAETRALQSGNINKPTRGRGSTNDPVSVPVPKPLKKPKKDDEDDEEAD